MVSHLIVFEFLKSLF